MAKLRRERWAHKLEITDSPISRRLLSKFISLDKTFLLCSCHCCFPPKLHTFSPIPLRLETPASVKSQIARLHCLQMVSHASPAHKGSDTPAISSAKGEALAPAAVPTQTLRGALKWISPCF